MDERLHGFDEGPREQGHQLISVASIAKLLVGRQHRQGEREVVCGGLVDNAVLLVAQQLLVAAPQPIGQVAFVGKSFEERVEERVDRHCCLGSGIGFVAS
jgi:hypothetical protein